MEELSRTLIETFGLAGSTLAVALLFFKHLKEQISKLEERCTLLEDKIDQLQTERAAELEKQIEVFAMLTKKYGTGS